MKRGGFLFKKIVAFDNLLRAARKALRGKRERKSGARFAYALEPRLLELQAELVSGAYRPGAYTCFPIRDPKPRVISAVPFRDRVVQHAICNLAAPLLERDLIFDTYACRRGKGTHAAVERAQKFATRRYAGQTGSFLKCDIRSYFPSIDHRILKALLARKIKDAGTLHLLHLFIDHDLPHGRPGKGLAIGNLTSQYFANLYLSPLDHFVKEQLGIKGYLRYLDDFLLFAKEKAKLRFSLPLIKEFLGARLGLTLKASATQIGGVDQGVPFLGFRIFPAMKRLQGHRWRCFKKRVRTLEKAYLSGRLSEEELGRRVNSMIGHVIHADTLLARRTFFMESWPLG